MAAPDGICSAVVPGSDVFHFERGFGRDTIIDFDAIGGADRQDYLTSNGVAFEDIRFRKSGDDVLMHLGDGDVVRILDVALKAIDETDFLQPMPVDV
jgi:hypothetical protein